MKIEEIYDLKDDAQKVNALYEIFDEDTRLTRSRAARVEFLTNVRYIEKYLKTGMKLLDVGAGAGEYSLYFAKKSCEVAAIELAETNVRAFEKKIEPGMKLDLRRGNALNLSGYADESFDVVLVFGPLYHLSKEEDRQRCIAEAMRVCKPDGTLFFAFISNDMVPLTEFFCYDDKFFNTGAYDRKTFKVEDFPFIFFTPDQCRAMLEAGHVKVLHEVASDGVSELLQEKINLLDEEGFSRYLAYHFYCCEKPEMLGRSNHLLFVGKK